jgi:hypothetical protein
MSLTTDPKDPRLTHYTGPEKPAPQADVYLVLSDEERAMGFVRPVRASYRHVGSPAPRYGLRDLTSEERARYAGKRVLVVGSGHSAATRMLIGSVV